MSDESSLPSSKTIVILGAAVLFGAACLGAVRSMTSTMPRDVMGYRTHVEGPTIVMENHEVNYTCSAAQSFWGPRFNGGVRAAFKMNGNTIVAHRTDGKDTLSVFTADGREMTLVGDDRVMAERRGAQRLNDGTSLCTMASQAYSFFLAPK